MVIQDVRGRMMSEGQFVDIRPYRGKNNKDSSDEATDTYDSVDWLIKHLKNNNGKVGIFGISYPGFYSTMAALSRHPAIKAVSPQAPVTNWFKGDDFHHNGAFFFMDGFSFYNFFGIPHPYPTTEFGKPFRFDTKDNYQFYMKTIPELSRLLGDSIAFWKDLTAHPNYDSWWKKREVTHFVKDILPSTAIMVVGGLFDAEDCYGTWKTFQTINESGHMNTQLIIGPWYHGQWARDAGEHLGHIHFGDSTSLWYEKNIEIPFFNHYLKGTPWKDNLAKATVFFSGENQWHHFNEWPPKGFKEQKIYLNIEGKLNFKKIAGKEKEVEQYVSDPSHPVPYTNQISLNRTREYMTDDQRFASRRPDVLSFQSPVLDSDLTVAGPVKIHLRVSISSTDADFVVKIIDVLPNEEPKDPLDPKYEMGGYQMLVRGEIMRGRYRNSFEKPQPFKPGIPDSVNFIMPDIAHTFKKGHRLMIQVQSSWFPLADRNPQQFIDIYHAQKKDFIKATIRIFNEGSFITIPVLDSLTDQKSLLAF